MCSCDEHTTILTGLAMMFLKRRHGVVVVVVVWVVGVVTVVMVVLWDKGKEYIQLVVP